MGCQQSSAAKAAPAAAKKAAPPPAPAKPKLAELPGPTAAGAGNELEAARKGPSPTQIGKAQVEDAATAVVPGDGMPPPTDTWSSQDVKTKEQAGSREASPKLPKDAPAVDGPSALEDVTLDWVGSAPPTGSEGKVVLPTWSPLAVKVQVLLETGWSEMDPQTTASIIEKINLAETSFRIRARGQEYVVDLLKSTQTNCSTGKERSIRILEVEDPTLPAEKERRTGSKSAPTSPRPMEETMTESTLPADVTEGPADPFIEQQREYGAQSRRGGATQGPLHHLESNPHALQVFADFASKEKQLCGEWAVFYHSYSYAALIYEIHAAVGAVLFRFRSQYSTLPRLLMHEFANMPDADTLLRKFNDHWSSGKRDHDPGYRTVAVSVMCSLVATGPEASPPVVFMEGYSCKDLSFRKVLDKLLESCYVPKAKIRSVGDNVIKLAEKHGLDVSQFGGKPCRSGKPGHLLQIFIRRSLIDSLCYAAKPYGFVDEERMPISEWVNSGKSTQFGQARILCHPRYFLRANSVRQFVASSDPTFHNNRKAFQQELTGLLKVILGEPSLREKAAKGIYGGSLPSWWTAEDQRLKAG
mmetsp:Transcript_26130/g.60937  ORF Transcript_26130/g.60937 Transcript_26130/m.60937 type:complete len:585 (+) Transcript_26130:147-1901(+)